MNLYSLVENPGTDHERVSVPGLSYREALREMGLRYFKHEVDSGFVQIMRECPDGTLSTEY